MKTTKKLSNSLEAKITKSVTLESYKGQQYFDALDIWGNRHYTFIGTNGKVNSCRCITVMRYEMDKQPLPGYNNVYGDETYTPQNSKLVKVAVIAFIIIAITLTSLFASAQTGNTIVQSGKTVVKLDNNRIAYVLSRTKNVAVRQALTNGTQTIRNNGQADIICAILKDRRN